MFYSMYVFCMIINHRTLITPKKQISCIQMDIPEYGVILFQ